MTQQQQVRQGDVLVNPIPARRKKREAVLVPLDNGRVVLAYGEVTGHAHAIAPAINDAELERAIPPAVLEEHADGTRTLIIARSCELRHEEHATIALAPGGYQVINQREYAPGAIRQVAD